MKDPATHRMVNYQARKSHGNFSSYEVKSAGDLEVCLNNRHSVVDSKTVVWEYDVTGRLASDHFIAGEGEGDSVNATLKEYLDQAEVVRRSVIKVRGKMARSKHTQWWLNQKVVCKFGHYTKKKRNKFVNSLAPGLLFPHTTVVLFSVSEGHGAARVHHGYDRHLVHGALPAGAGGGGGAGHSP